MKAFRFFLSLTLLTAMTLVQVPQSASGAMSLGMPTAMCRMPCCKTPQGQAKCPMMKAAPTHEAVLSISFTLQPYLNALLHTLPNAPIIRGSRIQGTLATIATLLSIAPPLGRAPPSDVVLFAA